MKENFPNLAKEIDFQEDQKEESIQPEQNEETGIQKKMRRGFGISGTTLNVPTSESYGC